MPTRGSNKRQYVKDLPFEVGLMGLNTSRPCNLISDQELVEATNWWINQFGEFEVRPGFTSILTNKLSSSSVKSIFYYEYSDEILFVCDVYLYAVASSGGDPRLLGEVNSYDDTSNITAVNFNENLYIASGGPLQVYDGSILTDVIAQEFSFSAPEEAGCVAVHMNRLWVGQYNGDNVYYSGVEDATDWGRDGAEAEEDEGLLLNGGSFSLDRDGDVILATSTYLERLFFLKGSHVNTVHEIMGTSADDFYPKRKSSGLSASSAHLVAETDKLMYFGNQTGVYSMQVVDQLGNVESLPESLKVGKIYQASTPSGMTFSERYGYLFIINEDGELLALHRGTGAWFLLIIDAFNATYVAGINRELYVGDSTGQIYKFDESINEDDGSNYPHHFKTKTYFSETTQKAWIERIYAFITYIDTGNIDFTAYADFGFTKLRTISKAGTGSYEYGFDGDMGFDEGADPEEEDSYEGAYSALTTYDFNDIVKSGDSYFVSLQDANTGNALTESAWWEEVEGEGTEHGFDEQPESSTLSFLVRRSCNNFCFEIKGSKRIKVLSLVMRGTGLYRAKTKGGSE